VLSSHQTPICFGVSEVHVIEVVRVGELADEESRQRLSINSTVNFARTLCPYTRYIGEISRAYRGDFAPSPGTARFYLRRDAMSLDLLKSRLVPNTSPTYPSKDM